MWDMPASVQIRNVPDDVVDELKARAAACRMSLSDYLANELQRLVEGPTLDDVLDRLAKRPRRDLGVSGAELVREARADAGPEV